MGFNALIVEKDEGLFFNTLAFTDQFPDKLCVRIYLVF